MEGFERSGSSPVREGEELDVTIEAVGAKGDGIAKKNGFVLFIPNTKEGDNVKVRVTKVFRKVGFAEVVGEGQPQAEGEEAQDAGEEKPAEDTEAAPQEEEQPVEGKETQAEPEAEDTEDFGEEEPKKE
jgi:predicted RNA-binding protein with TRAM domain|tara:strand:- start:1139 stop:1525 length:387 start_codon:yes stop_codon:yes gene_type:complete